MQHLLWYSQSQLKSHSHLFLVIVVACVLLHQLPTAFMCLCPFYSCNHFHFVEYNHLCSSNFSPLCPFYSSLSLSLRFFALSLVLSLFCFRCLICAGSRFVVFVVHSSSLFLCALRIVTFHSISSFASSLCSSHFLILSLFRRTTVQFPMCDSATVFTMLVRLSLSFCFHREWHILQHFPI